MKKYRGRKSRDTAPLKEFVTFYTEICILRYDYKFGRIGAVPKVADPDLLGSSSRFGSRFIRIQLQIRIQPFNMYKNIILSVQ